MDATDIQAFGEWLRAKRGDASIAAFAQQIQVSRSALQRYETGENKPSAELLLKLHTLYPDSPFMGGLPYPMTNRQSQSPGVTELRAEYKPLGSVSEFERRIQKMATAQSIVSKGFEAYSLKPAEHIGFHQVLALLLVRDDLTNDGLADLLQWYAMLRVGGGETLVNNL